MERGVSPLRIKAHFCDLRFCSATFRLPHTTLIHSHFALLRFRSTYTNSFHQCKRKHNFTSYSFVYKLLVLHLHKLVADSVHSPLRIRSTLCSFFLTSPGTHLTFWPAPLRFSLFSRSAPMLCLII